MSASLSKSQFCCAAVITQDLGMDSSVRKTIYLQDYIIDCGAFFIVNFPRDFIDSLTDFEKDLLNDNVGMIVAHPENFYD